MTSVYIGVVYSMLFGGEDVIGLLVCEKRSKCTWGVVCMYM